MRPVFVREFYCARQVVRRAEIINEPYTLSMKNSSNYQSPRVLQEVSVRVEKSFLAASLVDTAVVTSVGQEVKEYDFTSDDFNHQWEE